MKIKRITLIAIFLIIPAIILKQVTASPVSGLEVYFLDVGQGDAILVRNSQGQNILIDGGPDKSILEKIGRILPYGQQKIDTMILTHPHADHLVGLMAILERYPVNTIIYTGVDYSNSDYRRFQEIIKQKAPKVIIADANVSIDLADSCRLDILYPLTNVSGEDFKNINNSSIVSELGCNDQKILLMGDAEKEVEKELIENYSDLQSDILKLGHHGSKTASGQEFLELVDPQLAIILVGGDNKYGLPSPETIEELERLKLKVIRTDNDGGLKINLQKTGLKYEKL